MQRTFTTRPDPLSAGCRRSLAVVVLGLWAAGCLASLAPVLHLAAHGGADHPGSAEPWLEVLVHGHTHPDQMQDHEHGAVRAQRGDSGLLMRDLPPAAVALGGWPAATGSPHWTIPLPAGHAEHLRAPPGLSTSLRL